MIEVNNNYVRYALLFVAVLSFIVILIMSLYMMAHAKGILMRWRFLSCSDCFGMQIGLLFVHVIYMLAAVAVFQWYRRTVVVASLLVVVASSCVLVPYVYGCRWLGNAGC